MIKLEFKTYNVPEFEIAPPRIVARVPEDVELINETLSIVKLPALTILPPAAVMNPLTISKFFKTTIESEEILLMNLLDLFKSITVLSPPTIVKLPPAVEIAKGLEIL